MIYLYHCSDISASPIKKKPRGPVICTENPSSDHTYSITKVEADDDEYVPGSPGSSIDDEYDFGSDEEIEGDDYYSESERNGDNLDSEGESGVDEVDGCVENSVRTAKRPRLIDSMKRNRLEETSEEERKKIKEGADALLNLAEICLSRHAMRSSSPHGSEASNSSENSQS